MSEGSLRALRGRLLKTNNLPYKCMYCGEPADQKEHVIPRCLVGENTQKVWACAECNQLAGAEVFETIAEKRAYIQRKLSVKYAWVFRIPEWDDDELAELGRAMRGEVQKALRAKKWLQNRLRWDKQPVALVAEKLLEKRGSGKDIAAEIAALPHTELREMRLLADIEQSATS